MPKQARIFAWTIIGIGIAILLGAAVLWESADGAGLPIYLVLVAIASIFKVRLPGLTGTISPGFVFLLVAASVRTWSETVLVAVCGGLAQSLWQPKVRPSMLQISFNAATLAIAGGISHTVARSVTRVGGLEGPTVAMMLGVAGVVLLITNTMIVSTILCLIREVSVRTVWSSMQLSAVPYYLAGGVIANVWVRANFTANSGLAVIAVLSVYLLSVSYRELSSRIASA